MVQLYDGKTSSRTDRSHSKPVAAYFSLKASPKSNTISTDPMPPQPNSIQQRKLTSAKFKRNLTMTNLYCCVAKSNTRALVMSESDRAVQVEETGSTWSKMALLIME